jgi:quercetin dioxygenase-like cupin family protein
VHLNVTATKPITPNVFGNSIPVASFAEPATELRIESSLDLETYVVDRPLFQITPEAVCLSGADTGGAYSLLEASLAPGIVVPRHTHTREDETYHVLAGELEVVVGEETFVLREGDTLMAPRDIPHQLRNSGNVANHYLLVFSPSGIEDFFEAMANLIGARQRRYLATSAGKEKLRQVFSDLHH